jgi:hypothetical protein
MPVYTDTTINKLQAEVARLTALVESTRNNSRQSKLPGTDPTEENLLAKFCITPEGQGYTIDPAATMALHGWSPVSLMKTSWRQGSVEGRVVRSLVALERHRRGLTSGYDRKDFLRDYEHPVEGSQGKLDV